tara:strand:- start:28022 stop:29653 length:1632 start_codon:yes stop_codon:yes gene_type:complete
MALPFDIPGFLPARLRLAASRLACGSYVRTIEVSTYSVEPVSHRIGQVERWHDAGLFDGTARQSRIRVRTRSAEGLQIAAAPHVQRYMRRDPDYSLAMHHLSVLQRLALAMLCAATSSLGSPAQDDLRDAVTLKSGKVVRCRVFARYASEVLTVQIGRRREELPLADVVAMDTVRDRVREFFALLDRLPDNLKHRWYMAEWADARELPDLARLAALDVVLRDPDHQGAHTLLGHKHRGGRWLWPYDDEWKSLADVEKARSRWGHRWQIDSEHFHVESTASLRRIVDTLWDLERFHVAWFDRFADALRLNEVVGAKMHFEIWADERRYGGISVAPRQAKVPLFWQGGGRDGVPAAARTYFADEDATRSVGLFQVATTHLLYRTVADDPNNPSLYRPAQWGELGLGRYLDHSMTGPAGAATLGPWRLDIADARIVLKHPERDLDHVAQYDTKKYFRQVSDDNLFEWPAAELAVAWLLETGQQNGLRSGFFTYMDESLRRMQGTSSKLLDRHLGQPIQKLDQPWRNWIRQQVEASQKATTVLTPGK